MKRVIIIVVLVIACVGGAVLYKRHESAPPPVQAAVTIQPVSTVAVRAAPMVESVASYGNLVPERSVNIVPESPGLVKQILFRDGQPVTAGTPLVVMDSSIAEAQLQSSRAQADSDMQNLRRTQSLSRQGLDSTYSLEQAQSRASASQADVKINERKLAQLTLRAPFDGTLGSRRVDAGAFMTGGDTVVRLDDTRQLQIEFRLPSTVSSVLTPAMPVHIQLPVNGVEQVVKGALSFIDPTISTDTRSVLLRALVDNSERKLRPGRYVRVSLDLRTHPDALVVPIGCIATDLSESYVYVVDDKNIARKRPVTLGLTDGEFTELVNGVKLGEQVVTVGQFRLRDGDPVKIVAPLATAKSAS